MTLDRKIGRKVHFSENKLPTLQAFITASSNFCDISNHLLNFRENCKGRKNNPYFCSFLEIKFHDVQKISLKNNLKSVFFFTKPSKNSLNLT